MSLLGRALLFVAREVTGPFLANTGKHLGDALGTVLGRKIDPDHERENDKDPKDDEDDSGPGNDVYGRRS